MSNYHLRDPNLSNKARGLLSTMLSLPDNWDYTTRGLAKICNYISRVFPFLGVRFIAVNDGFDSSRPQDIDSLDTSFRTLIYDLYSRELSGKVKNAKRMRAEKGLFLSPFAPYGYVKDPDDKNRLVIDAEAADIVLLLQKERLQAEKKQARRELAVLQSRRNQLEQSLQDLYEKLIDGTIDKETYLSQKASNQSQMQELTEKIERLEKSSQATTEQGGAFIDKYKEYTELETLTTEIANDVVKRVTVYKDGGIEIELALRDELENLLNCLETVNAAS